MAPNTRKEEYPAFTNFTIKVNVKRSWPKTVKKVLKSVHGVANFRMEDDGKINISGYIDPQRLLKFLQKAGHEAQLVHWQYGECSNNLFEKPESPVNNNGYYLNPSYGGYEINNYGYQRYLRNYPYNHLECSGDASNCSGHHVENPRTVDKPSRSIFQKLSGLGKESSSGGKGATNCRVM